MPSLNEFDAIYWSTCTVLGVNIGGFMVFCSFSLGFYLPLSLPDEISCSNLVAGDFCGHESMWEQCSDRAFMQFPLLFWLGNLCRFPVTFPLT